MGDSTKTREQLNKSGTSLAVCTGGFAMAAVLIAADEIFDLPHVILNAPATSINWSEIVIEEILVLLVALFTLYYLRRLVSSKRERAERAVKESEEKYRATFEHSGTAMVVLEEDTTISGANHQAEVLVGYSKEEVVGKRKWTEFVVEEDLEMMKWYHRERREGEGKAPEEYEFRLVDREGNIREIFMTIGLIPGTKRSIASLMDITERRQMQEKVKASLKEKDALLQEVHHRVKNNLQVISSILDMSSLRVHEQQAIDLFADARAKIHTMALIHAQLYRSERFDQIAMASHVHELVGYLLEVYARGKRLTPVVEVSDVYLSMNQAVPCAIVLNELVSNAFKHAFKEGEEGTVKVHMHESAEGTVFIAVKDDGIGIADEVDIDKTDSLGLKLVRHLVQKQLKGQVRVERNKGTEFTVEFKMLPQEAKHE